VTAPVFNLAEQLAERQISLEEAAEKSGIPLERLQRVVAGEELSLAELRQLSTALKLPLREMRSKRQKLPDLQFLFRAGVQQLDPYKARIIDLLAREVAAVFDIANGLPINTAWINDFPQVPQTKENAEFVAQLFRQRYFNNDQESPFLSLPQVIAEQLGVFVIIAADLPIEGASVRLNNYAFILLAPRSFRPRMFFTLAHELGHFVAQHHANAADFANLDFENEVGSWQAPRKPLEAFADSFASALLLPAAAVVVAIKTFRAHNRITDLELGDIEINFLARLFGVSFEVAGRRCEDLGLLQRGAARAIYEKVSEAHKSPEKRADEVGLPPRGELSFGTSNRLLKAAAAKIQSGEISTGRAAEALHVTITDLFAANVGTK
jgi:Zn-dependent peptidase ImmA (M78 family)